MPHLIETSFGMWTRVGRRKHVLLSHWRHMTNTIELSCVAAMWPFCQITLTTCSLYWLPVYCSLYWNIHSEP